MRGQGSRGGGGGFNGADCDSGKVTISGLANLSNHRGQCYSMYSIPPKKKTMNYAVALVNLDISNSFVNRLPLSNDYKPLRPVLTFRRNSNGRSAAYHTKYSVQPFAEPTSESDSSHSR